MDAMPQRHLRRVTLLYLLCVAAVLVGGTLCVYDTTQQRLTYHYNLLLVQNMGTVTAMLQWLPTLDALRVVDLASLAQRTSFAVSVQPASHDDAATKAAVARGVYYTHAFPGDVYTHLRDVDAVVHVREVTAPYTVLGQRALMTAASLVFVVIVVAVVHVGLHAAQCLGARVADTHATATGAQQNNNNNNNNKNGNNNNGGSGGGARVWVRYVAYATAAVTLLSPVAVCAVQLSAMTHMTREVQVQTWLAELGRAIVLHTELYDAIARVYVSSRPVELLAATLAAVNTQYLGAHRSYSVLLYNTSARVLLPRGEVAHVLTDAEAAQLTRYLSDGSERGGGRGRRASARLPQTDVVVASAPLTQLDGCGLVVVYRVHDALPRLMDATLRAPSLLMLVAVAALCGTALLFFPYTTLGVVRDGGGVAWPGPWGWRASAYWPRQKLVHGSALLVLLLCAVALLACKLAEYHRNRDELTHSLRAQLRASRAAADAGARLLDNYARLFTNSGWNTSALSRYVLALNDTTLSAVSRFYQQVFRYEATLRVSQGSVLYAARAMSEADLPLLSANDDMNNLINENEYQSEVVQLTCDAGLWDVDYILAWLRADTATMRSGNTTVAEQLLIDAMSLDDTDGYNRVTRTLAQTLRAAAPLIELADAYTQQQQATSATWRDLSALYASAMGRQVVAYENAAFANAYAATTTSSSSSSSSSGSDTFYVNSYNVAVSTLLAPVLVAVGLLGLDLALDFVVLARVFARSRGAAACARTSTRASSSNRSNNNIGSNGSSNHHQHQQHNKTMTRAASSSLVDEAVPSNDYTAPSRHLRVHHRALWAAVRMGVVGTIALTVVTAATFVLCEREASRLMLPMTQQDTFVDSPTHDLYEGMQAMALTAYAAASWLRALASRHHDDYVTAAQATYNLSRLKTVRWLDTQEQQRAVSLTGQRNDSSNNDSSNDDNDDDDEVASTTDDNADMALHDAMVSSGGDDNNGVSSIGGGADANADVTATLQNVTTFATTLLDVGALDIYADFVAELQVAMTAIDVDKLRDCLPPARLRSLINTLRSYLFALLYAKPASKLESIYKAMNDYVNDTDTCAVPSGAIVHMRYATALLRRVVYDVDVLAMTQQLQTRALRSVAKRADAVQQQLDATDATDNSVDMTTMVWAAIVMTWVCTPLVYAIYRAATRAHEALYYS